MSALDVVSKLGSNEDKGLSSSEVRARRQKYGYNVIADVEQRSTTQILLLQFKNLPIILLLAASVLSYSLGRILESIAIFAVVFMTVGFGFFMEKSAERAISSLVTLRAPKAKVLRDGHEIEINAHDLVPGDIVEFEAGDKVPADCKLIESFDLTIDESPLTGESQGVRKDGDTILGQVELADRINMCYMGTLVLEGRAKAIVVSIGKQTEIGKVGELLQGVSGGKTPLEHKLEKLGKTLVIAVFGITGLYIAIGYFQGFMIGAIILSGIVLAIAAVPEGLPAVATITLAIGVKRMAKKHALIRRLAGAETLGSVTVICTDKTGTLTKNEPTLREIVLDGNSSSGTVCLTGEGFDPTIGKLYKDGKEIADLIKEPDLLMFLKAGALCNNAELSYDGKQWILQGDTTEGALVVAAHKSGIEKKKLEEENERIWEDPFDPKTRRMMTVHKTHDSGKIYAFIKGAPESILPICNRVRENGNIVKLDPVKVNNIQRSTNEVTAKGYRLLMLAYKELGKEEENEDNYANVIAQDDAILLGIAAIYDPPRAEVKNAIEFMKQAKTRVIMITGDHPVTAKAVARELKIIDDGSDSVIKNIDSTMTVMTGSELEKMSIEKLTEDIDRIRVFARATPEHKLKIVEALQRRGHIVAMTGDGVNDAPALKQADIGVAMGKKGTDVAKESAELILLDDNFTTITHAIELGRLIFANIKKLVRYLFSCNISEVMTMLVAIAMALPFPLLPLQLLWMNLTINTFPALALAAEKGDKNSIGIRPPAKHQPLISRKEWLDICVQSAFMTAAAIAVFLWALSQEDEYSVAPTMAFSTLSLAQTWHVLNYSSTLKGILGKFNEVNKPLVGAIGLSLGLLVVAIYTKPLSDVFELHPLNLTEWGIAIVASVISIVAANVTMCVFRKQNHSSQPTKDVL
jgi:Ca2+-transporting ATPase